MIAVIIRILDRRTGVGERTEEEIFEYMAKKAQKKAVKVAKKLKANAVSGYSNDSNPFEDSNLTESKNIEHDIAKVFFFF
ncbi:unnamed protein product, partial [Musa acuminata var. zebrina]